ncbi:MAG: PorT family protein [Crocinitomicaceae bacterium]|jgi:hypothetical protein|nr:PorT family protein [Crocinitomicaceae bacterium]
MKTIRNTLVATSFLLLFASNSQSQITDGFHYGIRLGIGESYLFVNNTNGLDSRLLLSGGLSANYQFNRFLGLSTDFLVTGKGGKRYGSTRVNTTLGARDYAYTDSYRLNYVEIPLMLKLSLPLGGEFALHAYTGPSLNFFFSGWQNRVYDNNDYNESNGFYNREVNTMNAADGSWVLGAGIDINTDNGDTYILDFRSSIGASPAGRLYSNYATNTYYMISVAYLLQ